VGEHSVSGPRFPIGLPGTYKLANEDGEELTNAWNIQQLRRFYP
jgi:hypothetical protein